MKPALGPEGRSALARVVEMGPLLAFDFDGTLAPIVARPDDARVPLAVARRLAQLSALMPVAVVTGRAVDDVADRLGFEPQFLVGNHGVEDPSDPAHLRWAEVLEPVRARLREHAAALSEAGVVVEDKRLSIALHYRLAPNRALALAAIDRALAEDGQGLDVIGGKCVVNLTGSGAPDKGDAVMALVRRAGAGAALFVGDDLNDEPVFEKAPPDWMTVRIGREHAASRARFYLDVPSQLTAVLQSVLDQKRPP